MMLLFNYKIIVKFLLVLLFIAAVVLQEATYIGSFEYFIFYSAVFFGLLITMLFSNNGYFYIFGGWLLFLGFWVKSFWHSMTGLAFVEPTGGFKFTSSQWDEVLLVTSVGVLSFVIAGYLFRLLASKRLPLNITCFKNPFEYRGWLKLFFIFFVFFVILVLINLHYRICIIGFTPTVKLLWPLNALITLMILGGGLALSASVLIWGLVLSRVSILKILVSVIFLGLILNISCMSRGLILTLTIPIFYATYINKDIFSRISKIGIFIVLLTFILSLVSSFYSVNQLRKHEYRKETSLPVVSATDFADFATSFFHFAIDRWTGVEGVMAVVDYDKKSLSLITQAIQDSPFNKPSIYEHISPWPSNISKTLASGVRNFSIPGIFAFLYYSDSLVIVGLITFFISLLALCAELLVFNLLQNPFFTSTLSWIMAFNIFAFSGVPKFSLPLVEFLILFVLLYYIFQRSMLFIQKDKLSDI